MFEVGQEVHGAGRATAKALLDAAQKRRSGAGESERPRAAPPGGWAVRAV